MKNVTKRNMKPYYTITKALQDDNTYKYSDDVIYTDAYWNTVKSLDRLWMIDNTIDGIKLIDTIEKRFGKKYECEIVCNNENDRIVYLMICSHYFLDGDNYQQYLNKMQNIACQLQLFGIQGDMIINKIESYKIDSQNESNWVIAFPVMNMF